jgi:dihydroorotase
MLFSTRVKILIKSALIADKLSPHYGERRCVLIENGNIVSITENAVAADKVIDGSEAILSVGWCDMRARCGEPGHESREDIASLCAAAAAGGFTDVAVLPDTNPVVQHKEQVHFIKQQSSAQLTQLHAIAAVTLQRKGEQLTEMLDLHKAGAVAFSDGHAISSPDIVLKTLLYLQKIDGLLINKPEERTISKFTQMHEGLHSTMLGLRGVPPLAETLAVARDLQLLEYTGGKIHFSLLSCAESVELIRAAKQKGLAVSCDIAAHQLAFIDADLHSFDTHLKVNPPFRTEAHIAALREALADGTIDTVVSDHTPLDAESKQLEFDMADFGISSIETTAATLNTYGQLSTEAFIEKMCVTPRRLLNLPQARIAKGWPACLTLFAPEKEWTYHVANNESKSRNNPFDGKQLKGKVLAVFNKGKFILR